MRLDLCGRFNHYPKGKFESSFEKYSSSILSSSLSGGPLSCSLSKIWFCVPNASCSASWSTFSSINSVFALLVGDAEFSESDNVDNSSLD